MIKKKPVKTTFLLIVFLSLLILSISALGAGDDKESSIVPLFGLENSIHRIIFWVIVPIILSIITALLFSRVFAPLFLKAKRKIYYRYEDVYIDNKSAALTKRMFAIRMIYIYLLTLGIIAFILPVIDVEQIISQNDYSSYVREGIIPMYTLSSIIGVIGFIHPIIIGLWAIGWAMENAGLIHHRLDDSRPGKLFEIEPIHIKYNSYLKGYSGITAILFIVEVSLYFANIGGSRMEDAIMAYISPLIAIALSLPAYIIYAKVMGNNSYLRKGLKEIKKPIVEVVSKGDNSKGNPKE